MNEITNKQIRRVARKAHIRKRVNGTSERPRLTVFRSHKNIYAQIIDDSAGRTLVAASSMEAPMRQELGEQRCNKAAAAKVGQALAVKASQAGIRKVVFDRNGYPFHGRIRELAEAARKGGLEF
jgi:large subunit ribosomal protein L18